MYQRDKSSDFKVTFRLASNVAKGFFSSVVPVFKIVLESSGAKNHRTASLLSVAIKVFEKLVNNGIVNHLGKYGLFSDFQYGF